MHSYTSNFIPKYFIFLSIFSIHLLNSQILSNILLNDEFYNSSGMEPTIAVNPNNADEAVAVWIERGESIIDVSFASLRINGNTITVVNQGTVDAEEYSDITADPSIIFLENEKVYVATISAGELYLSISDNLFSDDPTWNTIPIDNQAGADKCWISGFYDELTNDVNLSIAYLKDGFKTHVADIDFPDSTIIINNLDNLDEGFDFYICHFPTIYKKKIQLLLFGQGTLFQEMVHLILTTMLK